MHARMLTHTHARARSHTHTHARAHTHTHTHTTVKFQLTYYDWRNCKLDLRNL